jgi:peptidoglycan/LPS O-acetylase OafA/YrhL
MLGVISYKIYCRLENIKLWKGWLTAIFILFMAITLFYEYFPNYNFNGILLKNWCYYLIATFTIPFVFLLTKDSKFDAYVGALTYPVYIVHWAISKAIEPFIEQYNLMDYYGFLTVFFSVIVSIILLKLISAPIDLYRQERVRLRYPHRKLTLSLSKIIDTVSRR